MPKKVHSTRPRPTNASNRYPSHNPRSQCWELLFFAVAKSGNLSRLRRMMMHIDTPEHPDAHPTQQSMRADELDYDLPLELIATQPVSPRDSARMLVVQRQGSDWSLTHRHVRDLPEYIQPNDLLVFNVSRVVPARLHGWRKDTGGRIEGLFLDEVEQGCWHVMLKSNGRLHVGDIIDLRTRDDGPPCSLTLIKRNAEQWLAVVSPDAPAAEVLDRIGATPLPPYIIKARGESNIDDKVDRAWYQTVYAAIDQPGSVAAPTAGLHFTPELLARLDAAGAQRAEVVLHVGAGTFKPVTAATLDEHAMHEERFAVPPTTWDAIAARKTRKAPGRIIAVGTTTVRTLESIATPTDEITQPIEGRTRLLIQPGYVFKHVDAMLTNFHLPRSTLLALIAAMVGREAWRAIYAEAIRHRYRFYSYGDAMLILP